MLQFALATSKTPQYIVTAKCVSRIRVHFMFNDGWIGAPGRTSLRAKTEKEKMRIKNGEETKLLTSAAFIIYWEMAIAKCSSLFEWHKTRKHWKWRARKISLALQMLFTSSASEIVFVFFFLLLLFSFTLARCNVQFFVSYVPNAVEFIHEALRYSFVHLFYFSRLFCFRFVFVLSLFLLLFICRNISDGILS